jgi:radical SAM protein with 4Fe4S-binding SPASM domain
VYQDFPLRLEIDLTQKAVFLDETLYDLIIQESKRYGLYSLKFGVRNEPLLHDQAVEFIKIAKDAGITEVILDTNGERLDATIIQDIINARLDQIEITASVATQPIIDSLLLLRKFRRNHTPQIIVKMTTEVRDWDTVADQLMLTPSYDYRDKTVDEAVKKPDCPFLYQKLVVLPNGDVVPCEFALSSVLGNISQMPIHSLWDGDEMVRLRLLTSNKADICLRCPRRRLQQGQKII